MEGRGESRSGSESDGGGEGQPTSHDEASIDLNSFEKNWWDTIDTDPDLNFLCEDDDVIAKYISYNQLENHQAPQPTAQENHQAPLTSQPSSEETDTNEGNSAQNAPYQPSEEEQNSEPSPTTVPVIPAPVSEASCLSNPQSMAVGPPVMNPSASLATFPEGPGPRFFIVAPPPQGQGHSNVSMLELASQSTTVSGVVDVPILTDMEGEYGFTVSIQDRERTTKSPMWLMSKITKKLYTNINKAVPFEINLKKRVVNENFFIRAVPVFSSPQFLRTNVNRCPNHASPTDPTNHDFPYPEHVVRADHPGARYDNTNGRLSVRVPLDILQDGSGSDYTPVLLRFMCLGSCVGGINRRPIAIILTLENGNGHVVGRKVVDVRVCACPTRDIRTDENAAQNKGKRKCSSMPLSPHLTKKKLRTVEPKIEPREEAEESYTITVKSRKLFDLLKGVIEAYTKTHPEYAAKNPESSLDIKHNGLENLDRSLPKPGTDIISQWDSDEDSPLQLVYEEDPGDASVDKSTSSSPAQIQSSSIALKPATTMKLMVLESDRNGTDFPSTLAAHKPQQGELMTASPITIVSSLSSQASQYPGHAGLVNLSKHVPVVQVSQYNQGTLGRARSAPTFKMAGTPPIAIYRDARAQSFVLKEDTFTKTEASVEHIYREQSSPGSPELLAANVLAEGFAKEKSYR
ncbi:cellular tumor antigen p53-like isoform X2 [Penaeus japonicus]|uniref:cellular tumor antigen p53-like isoform X2 n=1 Tax=Penaeus japonicus TaxID=27405 RepID=UPI001C70DC14|nr:cellular tumor antigen p53-like isoform X2 [Penaeus japonicus]